MVRQPCLEDSLMILCGHGYRHMWSCLKWISDVAAFIHAFGSRLRWERLIDQARLSGGLRILGLGLWLAQEVGGAPVPRSAAQILRDRQIPALGHEVIAHLFADSKPIDPHGSSGWFARIAFHLRARERIREKLPLATPLLGHAAYYARRHARHYARRLLSLRLCRN